MTVGESARKRERESDREREREKITGGTVKEITREIARLSAGETAR